MWSKLRNRQIEGLKFVRQFPLGPYFADFACRDSMLIVEVDGETHHTDAQRAYDAERDMFMRRAGYRVLRFSNFSVHNELEGVLIALAEACRLLRNDERKG